MVIEIVKQDDMKTGTAKKSEAVKDSKQLTLGEKKMVAGVTGVGDKGKPVVAVTEPQKQSGLGGGIPGTIETGVVTPGLEVAPPDQDIKNMIAELQGGPSLGGEIGGTAPGGAPAGPPTMDVSIIKGLLYTVYRLPGVIYRVKGYKPPEEVMFDIDGQAEQLHTIMIRYGVADIKYIDLLVFGGGFAMNMASCIGNAKELRDRQLVDKEKALEMEKFKLEMEEAKLRKEQDRVTKANIEKGIKVGGVSGSGGNVERIERPGVSGDEVNPNVS